MKKVAGCCYILFRVLFSAAVWVTAVAASVCCIAEALKALNLVEILIALPLYTLVSNALQVVGPLALVFAVGMFGCRYLEDHLAQRKPVYHGVAELGSEIAAWLLKYDLIYIGITAIGRILTMLRFPATLADRANDPVGFVSFFLEDAWLFLFLAVVLILIHTLCKRLCRVKTKA